METTIMKKLSIVTLIVSSLMLVAAPALADETKTAPAPAKDAKTDKGYGYAFEDDPLTSGVSGTTGFVLKVRP
jgi:hypothetical protein